MHDRPGYHLREIERGEFGEASKIGEEYAEFLDAKEQGIRLMELMELSDLVGSINGYLQKYFPGFSIEDLIKMNIATQRAFVNGHRS